ncbi:hypothetical protein DFH05DRAFT_449836 [Lentinula detonsa]|uniref:Secreted protein n=1 Tax=Lentinula detonsa TaxID=2804962 RepID=A0A9W8NSJ6_9AGAR|nr:hypothetical protein DFH05DRAFT_449836 [Lentinula detonsa]
MGRRLLVLHYSYFLLVLMWKLQCSITRGTIPILIRIFDLRCWWSPLKKCYHRLVLAGTQSNVIHQGNRVGTFSHSSWLCRMSFKEDFD